MSGFPLSYLATFGGGFVAAAVITAWLAPVLKRNGAVALPGPDGLGRALPRGGGLAIVAVVAVAGLVAAGAYPASRVVIAAWLLPALAIAAVSLRDDFLPLPASLRLGFHMAAAAMLVAACGPVRTIGFGGIATPDLGALAWPLTILWVVGMTNAFNFMDGIDGIAGLTAAASGAVLASAAGGAGCEPVAVVSLALAAGAIGFLTANWPPARVFMGDVGSTFCGFTIAAVPLVVPPVDRPMMLSVAVLTMWPFLFDTVSTFLKRVIGRENVFEPHRGHLYQRLVVAGWSHRSVSSLYGFLAMVCGTIGAAAVAASWLQPTIDHLAGGCFVLVPVLLLTLVQVSEARLASGASMQAK